MGRLKFIILFGLFGALNAATLPAPVPKPDPVFRDYVYLKDLNEFIKIYTEKKTWDEAKAYCEAEGANLAVIRSKCEAAALINMYPKDYVVPGSQNELWIDLQDKAVEGKFETSDGEPISNLFADWTPGEPNNARNNEDCVALERTGKLNDETCSFQRGFICKKDALTDLKPKVDPVFKDYTFFRQFNGFIKIVSEKKTWREAKAYCEAEGANLAVVRSSCEAAVIHKMPPKMSDEIWIDLQDQEREGKFETSDGEPISKLFRKWAPGEPNNARNDEDCVAFDKNGNLNDETCSFKRGFVCKKNSLLEKEDSCSISKREQLERLSRYGYKLGVATENWYFKLHTSPKIWREALLVCESEGARLAVVDSQAEVDVYVNEIAKYPAASLSGDFYKDSISIGFYINPDDGKYVTLDGTPLENTGYVKWQPGEPSRGGEACGSIIRNGELNDVPCDNTPLMFICEAIVPKSPSKPICETYEGGYKYGSHRGDRFYKFHPEGKTWDEASLTCQSENAKLAVINSDEEAKAYVEEFKKHPESSIPGTFNKEVIHLGFHERFTPGSWVTIDGLPLSETGYTKWQIGQPDHNRDNEHCGSCYRDGLLNDLPCDEPFSFVCEKAYVTKNWPDGLCPTVCDIYHEGYDVLKGTKCESYELGYKKNTVNENKYYKLHLEGKNWDEALLSCLAEDANLAVITSDAEAEMYAAELALYPANSIPGDFVKDVASVGFYDRLPSGNYTTVNGVPLSETGFEKWAPNQPDNTNDAEHCGSIYRSGLLNDIRCDAKFSFFCEKITEDKCMLPTQTLPLPL